MLETRNHMWNISVGGGLRTSKSLFLHKNSEKTVCGGGMVKINFLKTQTITKGL